jgi:hypothetical protein
MIPSERLARTDTVARGEWLLPVLLLFNLAVAQPLYAVLSHGTAFFVAHAFTPLELVVFSLSLSLVIPAVLASLLLMLRPFGARWFEFGQLLLLWVLSLLALLTFLDDVDAIAAVPLGIAAAGASLFAALYMSARRIREFVRFASVVSVIFPLAFLFFSPVRDLMENRVAPHPDRPQPELEILDAPIFLLVFDELSTVSLVDKQGAIDAKNFPNFARLAARATWFRNATANGTNTEIAVPSVLTGRHPQRDLAPNASAHPVNLFTLLAPRYEVVGFEHLVRLCPESICRNRISPRIFPMAALRDAFVVYQHVVLPLRLSAKLPPLEGRWSNFAAETRSKQSGDSPFGRKAKPHFEAFLSSIDAGAPGKFFFIHSLLPHVPYVFLPDGRTYASDDSIHTLPGWELTPNNLWARDDDLVAQGYQRALLQTQMVDGLLGRFLDRLEELGLERESLIVVTSDHGANFVPGVARRGFGLNPETWASGMMVPLFVKLPGQPRGERSDRNVQSIDIAPTIVDALGRVPNGLFDGGSAIDAAIVPPKTKQPLPWRGERRELPADLTPLLLKAAALKEDLFRSTDGVVDYYRLAKFGEAIGLPLDRFVMGPEERASVVLDTPAKPPRPVPGVDFVAASIEGAIEGDATALHSSFLAIARGGRVVAIAKRFEKGDRSRFYAIVSPEFYGSEGEASSFYSITQNEPKGEGMRLFPLRSRAIATGPAAR